MHRFEVLTVEPGEGVSGFQREINISGALWLFVAARRRERRPLSSRSRGARRRCRCERWRVCATATYFSGRPAALVASLDSGSVYNRLYNPGFVLVEYFGFLRRDPDDPPDSDMVRLLARQDGLVHKAGEDARLERDAFERIKRAEMVRAFILSDEYRQRFGR